LYSFTFVINFSSIYPELNLIKTINTDNISKALYFLIVGTPIKSVYQ